MTSKTFDATKAVLQGDTLAPFLFIIVLDYVLRQTESGNYGVQMHPDKILADVYFADDIVLLNENSESAVRHVTCLEQTASSVGHVINCQKTKVFFINSDSNTLMLSNFQYLGSMTACPLKIIKDDVAWHGPRSGDCKLFGAPKYSASQLNSDFLIVLLWPSCRTDLKLGL